MLALGDIPLEQHIAYVSVVGENSGDVSRRPRLSRARQDAVLVLRQCGISKCNFEFPRSCQGREGGHAVSPVGQYRPHIGRDAVTDVEKCSKTMSLRMEKCSRII